MERISFRKNWYWYLIALFFVCAAALYIYCGEDSHIEVQDNLDLFQAQYKMLKDQNAFFSHGTAVPFLGGISRDVLPSELSLTGLIYFLLPPFAAYVTVYFVKIALAVFSFTLLAGEILGKEKTENGTDTPLSNRSIGESGPAAAFGSEEEKAIVVLCGFAYGILNLFPSYGISFASIPLYIFLVIRLYKNAPLLLLKKDDPFRNAGQSWKKAFLYSLGLFIYPFVSYFSYFGFFLLAYTCIALLVLWIRDRRFPLSIILGLVCMALGCVVFEYRLFAQMLFTNSVSIRSSMVQSSLTWTGVLAVIWDVFRNGIFHADGLQHFFILPLGILYFVFINVRYIVRRNVKGIFHDLYNLIILILVFNAVVYGLYDYEPFRTAVMTAVPSLRGFQFNRTVFFSPFLWYAALCVICVRLCRFSRRRGPRTGKNLRILAAVLPLLSIALILRTGSKYNDLFYTARALVYEKVKGFEVDNLSYREFYSENLFKAIKEDLNYQEGDLSDVSVTPQAQAEDAFGELEQSIYSDDENCGIGSEVSSDLVAEKEFEVKDGGGTGTEWALAYGIHPAVLEYNGIATLDGYLGFYAESYKDVFRKGIAPALESYEPTRINYDNWGARCYLFSGSENTIVQAVRNYEPAEGSRYIAIDEPALKALGCRYIFSRISLENAEEKNLSLRGVYSSEDSPYTIYVYELR